MYLTGKPDRLSKPKASKIDVTKMTISWSPAPFVGTHIIGYMIEYKEISNTYWSKVKVDVALGNSWEINDLKMDCKYHFRVAAKNKFGTGPPSEISEAYKTLGKKYV